MTSEHKFVISQNSAVQSQVLEAQMHQGNSGYDNHVIGDLITSVRSGSTNNENTTVSISNNTNNRRLNPEAREFMPPMNNMYMMPEMMPPMDYENYHNNFSRPCEFEVTIPHSELRQPYTPQTNSRRGRGAHGTFAASRNQYYNSYASSPLPQSTPVMPSRYGPNSTLINNYTNNESAQINNLEINSRQRRNREQQQQPQQQQQQNFAERRRLFDAEQDREIVEQIIKYVQENHVTENNFVDVVINLEWDMTASKLKDLFFTVGAESALILDQSSLPEAIRRKCEECQFRIGVVFFQNEYYAKFALDKKDNFAPYKQNKFLVRYCDNGTIETAPSASNDARSVIVNNNNITTNNTIRNNRTNQNNSISTQRLLQQQLLENNINNRNNFEPDTTHTTSTSAGVVHHISQDRMRRENITTTTTITISDNESDENDDGSSNHSRGNNHQRDESDNLTALNATADINSVFNAMEQMFIDKYRTQSFHLVVVHGLKSDITLMEWQSMVRPFLSVGEELSTYKYQWQDTQCCSGVSLFKEAGNAKLAKSKLHKSKCQGSNLELIARYFLLLPENHNNDNITGESNTYVTAAPVIANIFTTNAFGLNNNINNNNVRRGYRSNSTTNLEIPRVANSVNYNVPSITNLSTPSLQASRLQTPSLENEQLMLERLPESERHVHEEQHNNYGNGASTPRLAPLETTYNKSNTYEDNFTPENVGLNYHLSASSPYFQVIQDLLHAEEINVAHLARCVREFIHCTTSSVSEMNTLAELLTYTLHDNQHNLRNLHSFTETLEAVFNIIHQRNLREAEMKNYVDQKYHHDGDGDHDATGKQNGNHGKQTFAKCKEMSLIRFIANRLIEIIFNVNASRELRDMAVKLCGGLYNLYHEPTSLPECVYEKLVRGKEMQHKNFMSTSITSFSSGSASAYTPRKKEESDKNLHESYMAWETSVSIAKNLIELCQRDNENKATWDSMLCDLHKWEGELEQQWHRASSESSCEVEHSAPSHEPHSRIVQRVSLDEAFKSNERTPGANRFETINRSTSNVNTQKHNNNTTTMNLMNRSRNIHEEPNRVASNTVNNINVVGSSNKTSAKDTLTPSARPTPRALRKYVIPNPEANMTGNSVTNERFAAGPPEVQLSNSLTKTEHEQLRDSGHSSNTMNSANTPYLSASKQATFSHRDNVFSSIFASPQSSTRTQVQSYGLSLESSKATPYYARSDNNTIHEKNATHREMVCNPVPDVLMKTPMNARQGITTQSNLTPYVLTNTIRTNVNNNNNNNNMNRNELLLSAAAATATSVNAGATPTLSATGATLNLLKSPFLNYQHNLSNSNSNSNSKSNSRAESMDKKARTVKIIRLPDKLMVSKVRRLLEKFGQLNKVRIKHDKENKDNQKINEFADYGTHHEQSSLSFATHPRASDEICVMYVEFHERKEADSMVRFFRNINSSDNKLLNSLREPWQIQYGLNKTTVSLQFTEEEIQWLKQTSVTHANNCTEKEIELDAKWPLSQGGSSINIINNNNNSNSTNSNNNSSISVPDKQCEFGLYTPYATVYEYDEKKEEFEKRELEKLTKSIVTLPENFTFAPLHDPNYTLLPAANVFMPPADIVDPTTYSQTYLRAINYNTLIGNNELTSVQSFNEADNVNSAPSSMEKQVNDWMNAALESNAFLEHDDDDDDDDDDDENEDVKDDNGVHKTENYHENFALFPELLHSQLEVKPSITNTLSGFNNNNTNDNQDIIDNTSVLPAFGTSDNNRQSENINVTTTTTTNKDDDNNNNNADDVINYDDGYEIYNEWDEFDIPKDDDDDADWYKKNMEENVNDDIDMEEESVAKLIKQNKQK